MKIAFISHGSREDLIISFILDNVKFFKRGDVQIMSTTKIKNKIEKENPEIENLLSWIPCEDEEIASMAFVKEIDIVIFFRDPFAKYPNNPDVQMLMTRVCDHHDIPLATNYSTSKRLIETF